MTDDPYTMSAKLCDNDGIVRSGSMHHGAHYPCTGHAHTMGEHIYCTSPAHQGHIPDLPDDLAAVLRDPGIVVERDGLVWELIGKAANRSRKERADA